jgi:hypothetical protein
MSFAADDAWQRGIRDRLLGPHFYARYAVGGRYVYIDKGKLARTIQKRCAVDTIVQGRDGRAICVEEKITRPPKNGRPLVNFFLETDSCTVPGHESPGWMRYGRADYLLYCFVEDGERAMVCYLIDFPALQRWFAEHETAYPAYTMPYTDNHTRGRLVPIETVRRAVPCWRYRVASVDQE